MDYSEKLKIIRVCFARFLEYGKGLQRFGTECVQFSREGTEIVNFIEAKFKDIQEIEKFWIDQTYNQVVNLDVPVVKTQLPFKANYIALSTASYPSISTIFDFESFKQLHKPSENPIPYEDRIVVKNEIDELLIEFQEVFNLKINLAEKRKGAWDVFHSAAHDRLCQASHTMRLILNEIISKLAPNEKVKRAEWWIYDKSSKEGVSLEQRIRYLLFGEKEVNDEGVLEMMALAVEKSEQDFSRIKEIAHFSKSDEDKVEALLIKNELLICGILKFWKSSGK